MTDDRPVYVIRLRARPGVDSIAALRHVLRRLLRRHGLVCIGIRAERDDAQIAAATRAAVETGRPKKGSLGLPLSKNPNSSERLIARLKRDHPEIAAALGRGEYPTVKAAARAAGIVKPPDPYQQICKLWQKLSPEQRAAFDEWRQTR